MSVIGSGPQVRATTDLDISKNPAISPAVTAHSNPNVTQYTTRHGRLGGRSGRSVVSGTVGASGGPGCGGHTLKSSSSGTTKTIELESSRLNAASQKHDAPYPALAVTAPRDLCTCGRSQSTITTN